MLKQVYKRLSTEPQDEFVGQGWFCFGILLQLPGNYFYQNKLIKQHILVKGYHDE